MKFNSDKERAEYLLEHCVLEFYFGSTVYHTMTEHSDIDRVCIVPDLYDKFKNDVNGIFQYTAGGIDYNFFNVSTWLKMIDEHGIYALEGLFMPDSYVYFGHMCEYRKLFKLDKWKLRQTISGICSNAWAKAHKKMTIEADYDLYKAKKSLFHVFRLYDLGIQIATGKDTIDFTAMKPLWDEIYMDPSNEWKHYKAKYKPLVNQMRSELVKYCPKPV